MKTTNKVVYPAHNGKPSPPRNGVGLGLLLGLMLLLIVGSSMTWGSDVIFSSGIVQVGDADSAGALSIADGSGGYFALDWNPDAHTINVHTGQGPTIIQVGQETVVQVYNDTGADLDDGMVIHPVNGDFTVDGIVHVEYATAENHTDITGSLAVMTGTISDGEEGFATRLGVIRAFNTVGLSLGPVYISPTVPGGLTSTRPEFPYYAIQVGRVGIVGVSGQIEADQSNHISDDLFNQFNGVIREKFDFTVVSNGATITGTLDSAIVDNLTCLWSDGPALIDVTTPPTIELTAGLDTAAQINYIYIPESTRLLTKSTTEYPATEHIRVATIEVWTAGKTLTYGAKKNQNWNNFIQDQTTKMGGQTRLLERMRQEPARWDNVSGGIVGGITLDSGSDPDNIFVTITEGDVYQVGKQTFDAMDTEAGAVMFVANHPSSVDTPITNLNTQLLDATGASLSNKSYSIVLVGQQNKDGESSHLFINLPIGSYSGSASAEADALNYSVYAIPTSLTSTAFLIARFNFSHSPSSSGTWTLDSINDLRGYSPNNAAGGIGGGGGGSGAPTDATYITQTGNGDLSAEQAMGDLTSGIVYNTTTTGVQSIAIAGTDYATPGANNDIISLSALTGDVGDGIDVLKFSEATASAGVGAGIVGLIGETALSSLQAIHEDSGSRWLSGVLYSSYNEFAIGDTGTKTDIIPTSASGSLILPTDLFKLGRTIEVKLTGVYDVDFAAAGATHTFNIELGSIEIGTVTSPALASLGASVDAPWEVVFTITCWAVGSGTTAQVEVSSRWEGHDFDPTAQRTAMGGLDATTGFDSTSAQTITVAGTISNVTGSVNSIDCRQYIVKVLN